jgi:hypothetical protein
LKALSKKKPRPQIGDSVLILRVPPDISELAAEAQRAFRLSVGHQFKVKGRNKAGWLELNVGRVVDPVIGGFMNTIWIEPSCVRVVRRKSGAA